MTALQMKAAIDELPVKDITVWADRTLVDMPIEECMVKYDMTKKQVIQAEQREDIRYICINKVGDGDPHEIIDQLILELQAFKGSL